MHGYFFFFFFQFGARIQLIAGYRNFSLDTTCKSCASIGRTFFNICNFLFLFLNGELCLWLNCLPDSFFRFLFGTNSFLFGKWPSLSFMIVQKIYVWITQFQFDTLNWRLTFYSQADVTVLAWNNKTKLRKSWRKTRCGKHWVPWPHVSKKQSTQESIYRAVLHYCNVHFSQRNKNTVHKGGG